MWLLLQIAWSTEKYVFAVKDNGTRRKPLDLLRVEALNCNEMVEETENEALNRVETVVTLDNL